MGGGAVCNRLCIHTLLLDRGRDIPCLDLKANFLGIPSFCFQICLLGNFPCNLSYIAAAGKGTGNVYLLIIISD